MRPTYALSQAWRHSAEPIVAAVRTLCTGSRANDSCYGLAGAVLHTPPDARNACYLLCLTYKGRDDNYPNSYARRLQAVTRGVAPTSVVAAVKLGTHIPTQHIVGKCAAVCCPSGLAANWYWMVEGAVAK